MKKQKSPFVVLKKEQDDLVLLAPSQKPIQEDTDFLLLGNCMTPTLLPGDRVRLSPIQGSVQPGWIVSFFWKESILTHRVIRVEKNCFWARGDFGHSVQGPIGFDQLLGRASARNRCGNWQSLLGRTQQIGGLWFNQALNLLRMTDRRWPFLRRNFEWRFWQGRNMRKLRSLLVGPIVKDLGVVELKTPEQILAAWFDGVSEWSSADFERFEQQLHKKRLFAYQLQARSKKKVGQVVLSRQEDAETQPVGLVAALKVSYAYRGCGLGRRLLAYVEKKAKEQKLEKLWAFVDEHNLRSQQLFLTQGYRFLTSTVEAIGFGDWVLSHQGKRILEKRLIE